MLEAARITVIVAMLMMKAIVTIWLVILFATDFLCNKME